MIYLGAVACFLHAFLPLYLEITSRTSSAAFLQDELDYAQTIILLGFCLAGGVWWGSHGAPAWVHAPLAPLTRAVRVRLVRAAVMLATLGLTAWIYMIIYSGGLYAVYGRPYG